MITPYHSSPEESFLVLRVESKSIITRPARVDILGQFEVAHREVEMSSEHECFPLLAIFAIQ